MGSRSLAGLQGRCMLHQTCKSIYSLLGDSIKEERTRLIAQALPSRQEYEDLRRTWRAPDPITGKDMPVRSPWETKVYLDTPRESEIFACAILRGDFETVSDHLCAGVDPDAYSLTGGYMLHVAVAANQPEMVRLLLRYGADPCSINFHNQSAPYSKALATRNTALILAFVSGGSEAEIETFAHDLVDICTVENVQACIGAGIDFNQTSWYGETVAHSLAKRNCLEMFDLVAPHLTSEIMIKASKFRMETPLHMALEHQSLDLAWRFLDAIVGANILDNSIHTPLSTTLRTHHFEIAHWILRQSAHLPLERYIRGCELLAAILTGQVDIIRKLINLGVSKEQDKRDEISPFLSAVMTESLEIVKLVYEEGSKRPSWRYNPGTLYSHSIYSTAVSLGNPEIVNYLDSILDNDSSDLQIQCLPESGNHANITRKIMEAMSNLFHWRESVTDGRGLRSGLYSEIAMEILPLTGANLNSSRICELVEKAQHICPDNQTANRPTTQGVLQAIRGLWSTGEEEEEGEGEGEWTSSIKAFDVENAVLRLVRTVRKEGDVQMRTLFLETLEVVIRYYIWNQLHVQRCAYIKKHTESRRIPHRMDGRAHQVQKTFSRLCELARENVDNDEMDRLMLVISRLLRF
ncbi:unnamed protein product [Penicillium glandicola]